MARQAWVNTLPEIVKGLIKLVEEQGRVIESDEEWGERGRCLETPGLCIDQDGDSKNGPYRLAVYERTTKGDYNGNKPLLRLEIRPNVLWINKVKRLAAEPKEAEALGVHGVHFNTPEEKAEYLRVSTPAIQTAKA